MYIHVYLYLVDMIQSQILLQRILAYIDGLHYLDPSGPVFWRDRWCFINTTG